MSVKDDVKPRDRLQGVLDLARRSLPDIRRDAETIEPMGPSRLPAPLRRFAPPMIRAMRWLRLPGTDVPPRSLVRGLVYSFLTFVMVPTAVVAFYLFVVASNQYVVEARFAVRGAVEPLAGNALGEFASLITKNTNQDSHVVADYIRSQAMVADAGKTLDLDAIFGRPEADFWARFNGPKPIEELTKYWRDQVVVYIDSVSGVLTLEARAFRPEDALALGRTVVANAERLVNEISRRAQEDMVARNKEDLDKAEARMREAHLALQRFRNKWGIIDPVKSAEAIYKTLMELRKDKIKAENDLAVLRESSLDEKSRSIQTLVATTNAIDQRIAELQNELTTEGAATNAKNVTGALLEYEERQTERMISDKIFESMHLLYQRARIAAERQQVYLATFVPPSAPEISLYPRRGYALFIAFSLAFVLWSIAKLVVAGVKDHNF